VNVVKLVSLFMNSTLADEFDRGVLPERTFFARIQKKMRLPLSMEEFKGYWNEIFTENKLMVDLVHDLKKTHKVGFLSNTNAWHVAHLRKNHRWIFGFDAFVASCEVRMMKPDPKIYRLALEVAGAKPEETFYLDDIPENVTAARKIGMDAVQFKSHKETLKELKNRNILPV